MLDDLNTFMEMFDTLNNLMNPSDKSSPRLIDADCSNSIIGKEEGRWGWGLTGESGLVGWRGWGEGGGGRGMV